MTSLGRILAAHPLEDDPYRKVQFSRVDGNGRPLYRVDGEERELGASNALRRAVELHGATCFLCGESPQAEGKPPKHNLDHLRPKKNGGRAELHNLVVTCVPCNRDKAGADIVTFRGECASQYLAALDAHLNRCIAALKTG